MDRRRQEQQKQTHYTVQGKFFVDRRETGVPDEMGLKTEKPNRFMWLDLY